MKKQQTLATMLKQASSSFNEGNALGSDLSAMAFALENMSAQRFASISTEEEVPQAGNGCAPAVTGATETTVTKESSVKKAKTSIGEYWSKEASERVLHILVFDVVGSTLQNDASKERPDAVKGAALPKGAVPNGSDQVGVVQEGAEPVSGAALPKEATPDISKVLNSDMVAKAEAARVEKSAGFTQVACGIELASETLGYGVEISAAEKAQLDKLFA